MDFHTLQPELPDLNFRVRSANEKTILASQNSLIIYTLEILILFKEN